MNKVKTKFQNLKVGPHFKMANIIHRRASTLETTCFKWDHLLERVNGSVVSFPALES